MSKVVTSPSATKHLDDSRRRIEALERRARLEDRNVWRYMDDSYDWWQIYFPFHWSEYPDMRWARAPYFTPYVWTISPRHTGWVDGNYCSVRLDPDNERVFWDGVLTSDWVFHSNYNPWTYDIIKVQAQTLFLPGQIPEEYRPAKKTPIVLTTEIALSNFHSFAFGGHVHPNGSMTLANPPLRATLEHGWDPSLASVSYRKHAPL